MELDDALVKAELDDIMARIDGIMKNVEKFEGNLKEKPPAPLEESFPPSGGAGSAKFNPGEGSNLNNADSENVTLNSI